MLEGCRRFWSNWPESRMPCGSPRIGSIVGPGYGPRPHQVGPMLSKRKQSRSRVPGLRHVQLKACRGCNDPAILDGGLGLGVLADGGSRVANAATTKVDELARLDP